MKQMTEVLTRVMIVDDEDVFCSHLKSMINWTSHGFIICAEAGDGREAMEMLKLHDPEIVITDIQMPDVDGLSLIAHMAEKYPNIQAIALSGYDEYGYVRTGMKHGLLDYLLKHQITANGLLETLSNARSRIDDRRSQVIATRALADQAKIGLAELRRGFLRELLAGNIGSKDDLLEKAESMGIDVTGGYFVILVAEIDQMNLYKMRYTDAEWMMLFGQITDMVERIVRDAGDRENQVGLMIPQPENRFTILFSMPRAYSFLFFYNYVNICIRSIQAALKTHYNISACYSVSNSFNNFQEVPAQYERMLVKLGSKIYHGQDMVFREDGSSPDKIEEDKTNFGVEDERHIRSLLRDGHMDELKTYIDTLFGRWRAAHIEPGRLQMIFAELLSVLSRLARQQHIDPRELMREDGVYDRVRYMTLDEMKQFFLEGCEAFVEHRGETLPDESGRELTQKARSFIRQNYKMPISLADVANAIDVNPSYLSRVFKTDIGKTVVEYVNETRIDAAKRMIDEGEQPKDIAKQLGFNSASYFITVFRQATGKTPMQYKKSSDD